MNSCHQFVDPVFQKIAHQRTAQVAKQTCSFHQGSRCAKRQKGYREPTVRFRITGGISEIRNQVMSNKIWGC